MIRQWLILWTHGKKQQSHPLNQGWEFELKREEGFSELEKSACLQKESDQVKK